jgi:hypothetical protein
MKLKDLGYPYEIWMLRLIAKKQQHFMTNIVFRDGSRKCTEKRANKVRVVSLV